MLDSTQFVDFLEQQGFAFFTGVPDSQLQSFCVELYRRYGTANARHVVAVNEGSAVGLAAGYHVASGRTPVVYLQNSGLGNAVNPATSLADPAVYAIPILYLIGWRGEPGVHDEPQHVKMGRITPELLGLLQIDALVVDETTTLPDLARVFEGGWRDALARGRSVALVVRKGTFAGASAGFPAREAELGREEAIRQLASRMGSNDFVISTTGKISRELFEFRKRASSPYRGHDFFTVGSMGHSSAIALSVALQHPDKTIWCLDGDGAALMHLGSLATIGSLRPKNLIHVVLNNGAHESVGGMPTAGLSCDLCGVARAGGYQTVQRVASSADLDRCLRERAAPGPQFLEVLVGTGSRADLMRPDTTPEQNRAAFMAALGRDPSPEPR